MKNSLRDRIIRLVIATNLWHFVWLAVATSEVFTAVMSLILRGRITSDYLITGGVVSLLVTFIVVYFIKLIRDFESQAASLSRATLNSMKDAVSVIDVKNFRILSCNDVFLKGLGFQEEDVVGKTCHEITHQRSTPCVQPDESCPLYVTVDTGEYADAEHVHFTKDGTKKFVKVSTSPIKDKNGDVLMVVHMSSDITEIKELHQELERLAETDSLTGTYNRSKYEEIIAQELARSGRFGRPLSLIMFDIDHFKEVNDKYGHAIGDQVLKGVADIVREHKRQMDHLFRWGGEEFMIVALEADLAHATYLAERIRKAIESSPSQKAIKLTVSFGVTQYKEGDTDDTLLKRADAAMYKAKSNGRNRVETMIS